MNHFFPIISNPSVCAYMQFLILLPFIAALVLLIVPGKYIKAKGIAALIISLITGFFTFSAYSSASRMIAPDGSLSKTCYSLFGSDLFRGAETIFTFSLDNLSRLILIFISLFAILILVYSLVYIRRDRVRKYYEWFLLTIGCSYGVVLADSLIMLLIFWGMLGIFLYKMIPGSDENSSAAAKKTLIIVGASDCIMILGIGMLYRISGSFSISSISLPTDNILSVTAFLALLIGSFTKAGAFPFHTWVPDYTKDAPASSSALLPASLDKLLGIYLLARITTDIFILSEAMKLLLLITGVITIITAVMMALVQHNYKRLLGFHAVSQVGYMIVGFGLGSMIGIAAGLFHMINNALYKSGLFLTAGNVEYRTGEENIDELGGLSVSMPVTFASALIFAVSISGVPPFNGFASKWMIYQGIIDLGAGDGISGRLWIIWLGMAVLGSALTLASFIKLIGGIFLGRRTLSSGSIKEVPFTMWLPPLILAILCTGFGIFATGVVVPKLFMPVSGEFQFSGFWNSSFVSLLVVISLILGILFYFILNYRKFRREDSFIGGERFQEETSYSTPEFYKTISEFRFFSWIYDKAERKWFDLYDLTKRSVLKLSALISDAHSGVLPDYIIWVCAGLVIMLIIMI